MHKVGNGIETQLQTLDCTYDAGASTVVCDTPPQGTWRFIVHDGEWQGGFTLRDGTAMRLVRVRRR